MSVFSARPVVADVANTTAEQVELRRSDDTAESVELSRVLSLSDNGRFAVISSVNRSYHVDLATGAATELSNNGGVASDDGSFVRTTRYVDEVGDFRTFDEDVDTGEITEVPPPPTVDLGYDPDIWNEPTAIDNSADDRYWLLQATVDGSNARRHVVYDRTLEEPVTSTDGLPPSQSGAPPRTARFGTGSTVEYFTSCCVGSTDSFEILDYLSGERESIEFPGSVAGSTPTLSPDAGWMAFYDDSPDVIDGLDDTPRLYRRNNITGVIDFVPVDERIERMLGYGVSSDGLITFWATYTGVNPDYGRTTTQVFAWQGGGPATPVSAAPDGELADRGVESPVLDMSHTRVVFASFSTNLVPGLPGPGDPGDFERRLFIVDLSASPEPDPEPELDPGPDPDSAVAVVNVEAGARVDNPATRCMSTTTC